jgi:hypothetical protein
MTKAVTGFLTDDAGRPSSMRLALLISTLAAAFVAVYSVISGCSLYESSVLVGTLTGSAGGAKVWQKKQEAKNGHN